MKLDADFLRSFDLEKAHGPIAIIPHLGVSGVVTDDHIVPVGEIDYPSKKLFIRDGGGWIVGIVDPEKLCLFCDLRWDRDPGESDSLS